MYVLNLRFNIDNYEPNIIFASSKMYNIAITCCFFCVITTTVKWFVPVNNTRRVVYRKGILTIYKDFKMRCTQCKQH